MTGLPVHPARVIWPNDCHGYADASRPPDGDVILLRATAIRISGLSKSRRQPDLN